MQWMFWKSNSQEEGRASGTAKKKKNYKYSQHDVLGTGGSSVVYKATWNGRDTVKPSHLVEEDIVQVVAFKIVPKPMIHDRLNYIKVLSRQEAMSHPGVLCLLDWFESSSKYYLTFELAAGGDLFDRLAQHPYTEEQGARVMRQMLEAVHYCHQNGIVHRDIKPENWLFRHKDSAEGPMLADFGVAQVLDDPSQKERLYEVCGTPGYAAPEVFLQHGYNRKCDVFSCGVVGYALLTSWSPWKSENAADLVRESREEPVSFNGSNWSAISNQAKDFIAYLMKADPEARPSISQALAHPWVQQATAAISTTKARDIPQSVVVQEARSRSITRNMPTLSHQRPGDPLVRTVTAQIQASQQKQQSQ